MASSKSSDFGSWISSLVRTGLKSLELPYLVIVVVEVIVGVVVWLVT